MERYFVQYICATKDNDFKAHYVIYQKSPLQLANKTKYKRYGSALRVARKLEQTHPGDPAGGE